ncbi:MAG: type II toxin-antitoxin system prevent-host-death family antitoxin [Chloroflexota bacterium]
MSGSDERLTIVEAADAPEQMAALLNHVSTTQGRTLVRDRGKDVAALVSVADLERLQALDRQRAERFKVIGEIHARNAHLDPADVEDDVADEIAAMRAEEQIRNAASTLR